MNIQWYPGHMTKARRMMQENIALVDIVIELLDARIPYSSKNPDIDPLANGKKRLVLLNKADLADPAATAAWTVYYEARGFAVVQTDAAHGKGMQGIADAARELMREKVERLRRRGRIFVPTRAMIAGIPNVGKSTLINQIVGKHMTRTSDRPGVTRGKQWVKIKKDFELLDTPGILWPKFEDQTVGLHLAFTGAVKDDIMDIDTLAQKLIDKLRVVSPGCLTRRYGVTVHENDLAADILIKIAEARGFKIKGGEADAGRAAITLLDEFRGGKLGRITLEWPEMPT